MSLTDNNNNLSHKLADLTGKSGSMDDFFKFVEEHLYDDPSRLRLSYAGKKTDLSFDVSFAIDQVECRKRTVDKLSRFTSVSRTLFPAVVSSEQASDEGIALFHASLLSPESVIADLTAGLGIDAIAAASVCAEVYAVELDTLRSDTLIYNKELLGLNNMEVVNADSMEWIKHQSHFDTLFIDPSRRGENNSRKYSFADCLPDITLHMPMLLEHCDSLLVKASPLLDLKAILNELPGVTRLWVLSRKREVKEILIEVKKEGSLSSVTAAEIDSNGNADSFIVDYSGISDHLAVETAISYMDEEPAKGMWLYEPSPAIMKIAPWSEICSRWPELRKMSPNSHLFVSADRVEGFPGKELRIESILNKKEIKSLKGMKTNVLTRNYPLSSDQLKKKCGVTDGGDIFLIGTRIFAKEKPILILASRLY